MVPRFIRKYQKCFEAVVFLLFVRQELQTFRAHHDIVISPPRGKLIRPTCIGTRITIGAHLPPACVSYKRDLVLLSNLLSLLLL